MHSPDTREPSASSALTQNVNAFLQNLVDQETAARAYERWVAQGRPENTHLQDWLNAEAEVNPLHTITSRLAESSVFLRQYFDAHKTLEWRVQQMRAMAEAALALNAAGSLQDVLQVLTDRARQILGAHQAAAAFLAGESWDLAIRAVSLSEKYAAWRSYAVGPDGSGIYALVCETNRPLRLTHEQLLAHPRWRGFGREADLHPPLRGWLAVPLIDPDGSNLGVTQLSDRDEGDFTEEDELILVQLAQLASAALLVRKTRETLEAHVRERTAALALAHDDLQKHYNLLQAITEGINDAVYVKDQQGRYLLINAAGARFLGRPVEEILGKDDTTLFSPTTAAQIMEKDRLIMASGETQTYEDVGTAAGVTRTYLSTKGAYRDARGNVIGLFGLSRDITEAKQARQRQLAEHAVTRALAESADPSAAAPKILQAVCDHLGWDVGLLWTVDRRKAALRCVEVRHAVGVAATDLEQASRQLTFTPGIGLPGRVWALQTPVWSLDVASDGFVPLRMDAVCRDGLQSAVAFPVHGGDFLGVLEFFSRTRQPQDQDLLNTLVNVSIQVGQFLERKQVEKALHERDREFAIARDIQQGLLPRAAPILPGFTIAGVSYPAQETGGDYFDFFPLADGSLGIAVGDASGHGIGAALLIAATRAYLRGLVLTRADLGQILSLVNQRLCEDTAEERYVTLLLASLDPVARRLAWSNAGHWPGYILDAAGEIKAVLDSTGGMLGFEEGSAFPPAPALPLTPGDLVFLYTDGIKEAVAKTGGQFGKQRMLELVRARREEPPRQIVEALCRGVREFAGDAPFDDMTAVIIKAT